MGRNFMQLENGPSITDVLIRFEETKGLYAWVTPDDIVFVKSADHYVRSLIQHGAQKKWMVRHTGIKELLTILTGPNFVRLNKFYLLNRNYFQHYNEDKKTLYLDGSFPVSIPHRISPYILDLLRR